MQTGDRARGDPRVPRASPAAHTAAPNTWGATGMAPAAVRRSEAMGPDSEGPATKAEGLDGLYGAVSGELG